MCVVCVVCVVCVGCFLRIFTVFAAWLIETGFSDAFSESIFRGFFLPVLLSIGGAKIPKMVDVFSFA